MGVNEVKMCNIFVNLTKKWFENFKKHLANEIRVWCAKQSYLFKGFSSVPYKLRGKVIH